MSIVKLPLSNGGVTLVDDHIAKKLNKISCYGDRKGYVFFNKNNKHIRLHRFITNAPKDKVVDHLNGKPNDNRVENLRVCTQSENLKNQKRFSKTKTGYRSVYCLTGRKTFQLKMRHMYKTLLFGHYRSRHIAAIFADQLLVTLVGPFVKRNFDEKINSSSLMDFLNNTHGRIFRVVFSRRSDGKQREMVCRTGVKAHQSGGIILFNPISRNLFSVYDVQKKSYRFIPLENVICIRFAKTNYRVVA